jgi:hypothetical protein
MIYLLTTVTGEERLIGSQQESLSGGALQFYLRISGELRLQVAYAPGTWKHVSRIPKEEAQTLITQGIEHDKATLLHIEGRLEKPSAASSATGTASASVASGQAHNGISTEGFKARFLGKAEKDRKLTVLVAKGRFCIKAQPPGDTTPLWVDLPAEYDPSKINLTQAEALVAAHKPPRSRSSR